MTSGPLVAIVKPTHECNFACKYCYVAEEAENGFMDDETLYQTIKQVIEMNAASQESEFIWHGGEPLLMGIGFFEKIAEIQQPYLKEHKIKNSVQSNGTLLIEELAAFFAENHFGLGFSLDGPRELNDRTRVYKNGSSAFDDILRGIRLATKKRISAGFITVVNRLNACDVEKLYDFCKEEGLSPKVNPLIKSGRAVSHYDELAITPFEYGRAMIRLFDLWFYDYGSKITIDPFDIIIGNIISNSSLGCNYSVSCQNSFVSIGPLGDIYPCGRFDGVKEFRLGNLHEDGGLESALNSELRKKLQMRSIETIKGCDRCEYGRICNCGCMHNAYMIRGNAMDRDYYCGSYRMVFKHVERALHKELSKAEGGKNG